ncbi:DUF2617 family protein [Halosimplex sp. J119]
MTRDTLQFVHSTAPPAGDVRVFDSLTRDLLGATFTFRVIGSSHYVSAPAYDFHELASCEPVDAEATTLRLDGATTADPPDAAARRRLDYAAGGLRCATVVERRPLAAFPADDSFDLAYRFDPDAYTTVDVTPDGYETYHTYPEFDLALYTRTAFESVPGGDPVGESADGTGDYADHVDEIDRSGFPDDRAVEQAGQPTD